MFSIFLAVITMKPQFGVSENGQTARGVQAGQLLTYVYRDYSDICVSSGSGIFEVNCSRDLKVQGIIGPCASLEKVCVLMICMDDLSPSVQSLKWFICLLFYLCAEGLV